ncbi:hypothetical protein [Edaphocola aurantiacus]|uniref:hypothetical protein n=1 Tax=Edaphocola aurantiacus TaxID=2601682 RepID=UPI001C951304|nr:hypothetical protein [Edaphocola aurantiacus]
MKYLILTAGLCFGLIACNTAGNPKAPAGAQEVTKYHSKEIGWTITVPEGYTLSKTEELDRIQEKGKELMENSLGEEIDMSGVKHLANFTKNQFNQFQSNIEPFDTAADGNWYAHDQLLKGFIYETFTQQGIHVDSSVTEAVTISGKQFQHYTFSIYGPDQQVILRQDIFGALLNGYSFGVNINYNDSTAYKEMLQAWQSSVFQ